MLLVRFFGYRYLDDGGTDRREILPVVVGRLTYEYRMRLLPFWRRCCRDRPNPKFAHHRMAGIVYC